VTFYPAANLKVKVGGEEMIETEISLRGGGGRELRRRARAGRRAAKAACDSEATGGDARRRRRATGMPCGSAKTLRSQAIAAAEKGQAV
jgi:hypothetical protein